MSLGGWGCLNYPHARSGCLNRPRLPASSCRMRTMPKFFTWSANTVRLQPSVDIDKLKRELAYSDSPDTDSHDPVVIEGVDGNDPRGSISLTVHPWALDWYFITDSPDDE